MSFEAQVRFLFLVVPFIPGLVAVIIGVALGFIMRFIDNKRKKKHEEK